MAHLIANEHFDVVTASSTLTFSVRTTTNSVHGKVTRLTGFFEGSLDGSGEILMDPKPKMHVEFQVDDLHSGNTLKDAEMCKLIDNKRFPKIAADLIEITDGIGKKPGTYPAKGRITLAGRGREYDGLFTAQRDREKLSIEGYLKVDTRDFGLKQLSMLSLSVEPVVNIHLHMVAVKSG